MSTPIEFLTAEKQRAALVSRPFVTLSYAQSLDGSIARARGEPLSISSPESMRVTHELRAWHSAILIGRGTLEADDPRLTVRLVEGSQPQPVVLDSRLQARSAGKIFDHPKLPWFVCGLQAENRDLAARAGALVQVALEKDGRVSLPATLQALHQRGIESVMVEGGAEVITAFLSQGLADVLVLTIAPLLLGGLRGLEVQTTPTRPTRVVDMVWAHYGADLVAWGRLTQ